MCSDTNRLTPSTDTIPGAPSLFLASRGLIPKLRKREGSPSRQYQSLQRCQLHSLISPEVSGVLQVQTLTKQCRERNPTLRNTHTHRFQAWLLCGPWSLEWSPYLYHRFPSRPLVLSAPLCFVSWIFSFPGL